MSTNKKGKEKRSTAPCDAAKCRGKIYIVYLSSIRANPGLASDYCAGRATSLFFDVWFTAYNVKQ